MAASRIQVFAGANTTFASSVTTSAVTTTSGNALVVVVEADVVATNGITVTDSKGNTWARVVSLAIGGTFDLEIWVAYNITGGANHTVTATDNGGGVDSLIRVEEWNGLLTTDPVDKSAIATGSASSALDSGATATLSQADEVIIAGGVVNGVRTLTAGSGYSNLTQNNTDFSTLAIESKIVAATTAVNGLMTSDANVSWVCGVVTLKIAAYLSINKSDTVTLTENTDVIRNNARDITKSDTATTNENSSVNLVSFITVSDSSTLTENKNLTVALNVGVSDTATLSENVALTQTQPTLTITKSDTATLSESVSITFAPGYLSLHFDSINIGSLSGVNITAIEIHNRPVKSLTTYKLARQDGSKLVNAEYTQRILTVRGHIATDNRTNYELNRDTLLRYLQPQEATLQVTQASMLRNYTATVSGMSWDANGGGFGLFAIEFLCSSPFGQDTTATTLLNAVNNTAANTTQSFTAIAGTYKAQPTITVDVVSLTGGASKYIRITNPNNSKAITITRTWANSDSLVIDCLNQTAKVNGSLVEYSGVFPEWAMGDLTMQYEDTLTSRSVNLTFAYVKRYL